MPSLAESVLLDDLELLTGWSAIASEGARVKIIADEGHTGLGMRIDFDFDGAGGWINVQKTFPLPLPDDYVFSYELRGKSLPNNFEFKLIDPSGHNVWWSNRRDFEFPADWKRIRVRKARLRFAWGPAAGSVLNNLGALAFSIAASHGGKGSVWIDEIRFEAQRATSELLAAPNVTASSSLPGREPTGLLDTDRQADWKSEPEPAPQWLVIDFHRERSFGGLVIDWAPDDYALAYRVLVSDDGDQWTSAFEVARGNGGRDYVYMPEAEARYVKLELLESSREQGYGIQQVEVKPFAFSASANQFFEALATDAPPGSYPKYLSGKQTYWTIVGLNGDPSEALLNEEGMLEVDDNGFSLEPFLYVDGELVSWSSVETEQGLALGFLPIPSVTWAYRDWRLTTTAFASGQPWLSTLNARYRVTNLGDAPMSGELFIAVRPFQVNPPWQSLKRPGGVTPIRSLRFDGKTLIVNDEKAIFALTPADGFGAAPFERGSVVDYLRQGVVPDAWNVEDSFGYASAAFGYDLAVPAQGQQDILLAVPFHGLALGQDSITDVGEEVGVRFERELHQAIESWRRQLSRVVFRLPADAQEVTRTMQSNLAYILVNRDGAAIQPGSRSYARSWIRDGAVTSVALLEMGFADEAREFIRWFAGYQFADGKIPCCVDERGADPTPEHDSHGEFIYAVAEYYRFSRDIGFVTEMWPHVRKAVDYLDSLRRQRLGAEFQSGDRQAFYGLLPESISHEGYSSNPVHSYWDDFFALRGFKDAAQLAIALGDEKEASRLAELRDTFRTDLMASISRAMTDHGIDFIPGSADLGDFDATSTAIALVPGGELPYLPQAALRSTFEKYYRHFQDRQSDRIDWQAYTAYEVRNMGALVLLGQPERAHEVLRFLLAERRPLAWNQWPEITWRDAEAPKFLGDLPHTWIGGSFLHAVRTMFAYENEHDRSLVLAAGLPRDWITQPNGVGVERLPTHYGVLHYDLQPAEEPETLRLKLYGDLNVPPGGIVVRPAMGRPIQAASVNGHGVTSFDDDGLVLRTFPAEVVLDYRRAAAPTSSSP